MGKRSGPGRPRKNGQPQQIPTAAKKTRGRPPKAKAPTPPTEDDADASSPEEQEIDHHEQAARSSTSRMRGMFLSVQVSNLLEGVKAPIMTIRTRRIAKSVTKKRWSVLSPESRAQAIAILRDIERPVLMAIKNENRRTTAQALIEHTINRIDAKLEKIPLPLGSKDRHFDFERIVNENREMEASLVPDLQLIGQLEKEIEREKNLLDEEENQLNNLTKNAAREESSRKAQMKKMHALLKENVSLGNPSNAINLVSEPMIPAYDVEADKEISVVIKDLSSHLTTLNTNLREMKDVRAWINRAEESLGEILRRLEESEVLDRVYGAEVI